MAAISVCSQLDWTSEELETRGHPQGMVTHSHSLTLAGQAVKSVQRRGLPCFAQHDVPCTHPQRGHVSKWDCRNWSD